MVHSGSQNWSGQRNCILWKELLQVKECWNQKTAYELDSKFLKRIVPTFENIIEAARLTVIVHRIEMGHK